MTAPMPREELPITALQCRFCGTMPYVAIKDRAVISCRGEDCFGPRTTADYLVDAIAQWNRRQVTVAMYQDRVKEILNLTDENDRLRSGVAQKPSIDPADLWERYLAETENPSPQGAMAFVVEVLSNQGASK